MRTLSDRSPMSTVLGNPEARARIGEIAPELLVPSALLDMVDFPVGKFLELSLAPEVAQKLLTDLSRFEDTSPQPPVEPEIIPSADYESPSVERAGAAALLPSGAQMHRRCEVVLEGPSHGNPFVDVELSAIFRCGDVIVRTAGFYDGAGRYIVRLLPSVAGRWEFTVASNARSLDGVGGTFDVAESVLPGPVHVTDTFHFAHADGRPFVPLGTTLYAWTHQGEVLEEQTLATLAASHFTKVRMCLFPKHFFYNTNEPERFVFPRDANGGWDTTSFDPEYFAHLEQRIEQLEVLGIQADLILFHPYDRWGFSRLGATVDDRYLRYVVRRLASFPNVWWSMANEYDLLLTKDLADWNRLGTLVRDEDPYGHPLSIHNWVDIWDFSTDWTTHCSIQRGDPGPDVVRWREFGKPVVIDECGYEGDLDHGWGNQTAEEVVRQFWEIAVRGGYATHGETYLHDGDETVWWAKGGELIGGAPARLAFLGEIIAEAPGSRLDPLPSSWDYPSGGVAGQYILTYYGRTQPRFRDIEIPAGMTARIDVIDTWNMTIEQLPGEFTGSLRVDLPARPYICLRLRAV